MELWDEEKGEWTSTRVNCRELIDGEEDAYEPTAVTHPFSHREFRSMAEKFVIPPMVLDLMLKGKDHNYSGASTRPRSTWKPIPRASESSRNRERATNHDRSRSPASGLRSKKATTWTGKMGGVRDHTPSAPLAMSTRPPARGRGFSAAVGRGVGVVPVQVGGATSSTSMKPKVSGRGRALRMRAERGGAPLRRPGRPVSS